MLAATDLRVDGVEARRPLELLGGERAARSTTSIAPVLRFGRTSGTPSGTGRDAADHLEHRRHDRILAPHVGLLALDVAGHRHGEALRDAARQADVAPAGEDEAGLPSSAFSKSPRSASRALSSFSQVVNRPGSCSARMGGWICPRPTAVMAAPSSWPLFILVTIAASSPCWPFQKKIEIERVVFALGRLLPVGELGPLVEGALPGLEHLPPGALAGRQGADLDGLGALRVGLAPPAYLRPSPGSFPCARSASRRPYEPHHQSCGNLSKHEGSPSSYTRCSLPPLMGNSFLPANPGERPIEGDAVVILDELVRRATRFGSSDIHLEPKRDHLQVRFRIDGAMTEQGAIASDVAGRKWCRASRSSRGWTSPSDASRRTGSSRSTPVLQGRVHLRASTFPCSQGEKVVLRILLGQKPHRLRQARA